MAQLEQELDPVLHVPLIMEMAEVSHKRLSPVASVGAGVVGAGVFQELRLPPSMHVIPSIQITVAIRELRDGKYILCATILQLC